MVAAALGGKRRFRTTENFGKEADDVKFPKAMRRQYSALKNIAIECKKRKNINVHALFAEATMKYCKDSCKNLVFASKITQKRNLKKQIEAMENKLTKNARKKIEKKTKGKKKKIKIIKRIQRELKRKIEEKEKQIRFKHDITALVTVDLNFFTILWKAWLDRCHNRPVN